MNLQRSWRWLAWTAAVLATVAAAPVRATPKGTFAIDYIVTISAKNPKLAHVRWELSGIDEIQALQLRFPSDRFDQFAGTGVIETSPGQIRWMPGGPYAHLSYRVQIDHQRGRQHRYDSHATSHWVITRARDLFPRILLHYAPRGTQAPKSRARLIFHLPHGWRSVTAHEPVAPDTYTLFQSGKVLDRPRGWIALGKLDLSRREIADTMVYVARVAGATVPSAEVFQFYDGTLPAMKKLFGRSVERILIVSAPDPMWHGGISGTDSFFIHGDRPLRTPDKTSPYLHELFHILQPYKPAADADWIEEGLAEYYSLELQRRAGVLDAGGFARGLAYLERYGLWHVDLTRQQDNAATNNSAPLVMYALDQRIQRITAGARRLDDVVMALVHGGAIIDTARFKRAVEEVAGRKFDVFFRRHVTEGQPPRLRTGP